MVCPCTGTAATAWRTAKPLHGRPAPAGPLSGTGRDRRISRPALRHEKRPARASAGQSGKEKAGSPPPIVSAESGHLSLGRLAVERCARVLDRSVEGLPGLANHLFVGGHRALGRHAQRVGLNTHVGRELPLALGGAIIADRPVEILVAGIVRCLGGCVARFGDGAGVELSGAMRRSDEGSDDPLQMDLHGLFAQAFGEAVGGLDDQPLMLAANAVAVDNRVAEALGDLQRLDRVGAGEADHFECGAAARLLRPGVGAIGGGGLGHVCSFRFSRSGSGPCRSALRCGRPEPAKEGRLHRSDPTEPAGQVRGPAGFDLLGTAGLPSRSEGGSAAPRRDSGLETTGRRFRPQRKEGQSGTGPISNASCREATWPSPTSFGAAWW